jgi:hypothetical protein
MAIPNTTPTPNELYNGEMKKMGDTELRVVLVVTRATLGWEEDKETKMRKQEDWISYYQLKEKTGRGYTALAKAIENCIEKKWIEARDKEGNLLDTKSKRVGKKIYYRLGKIFLDKIEASSESGKVKPTSSESVITESVITESEAYKRNSIQKKPITKELAIQGIAYKKQIDELIGMFKTINPTYQRLFGNSTERQALERLVKQFGFDKVANMIQYLPSIFGKPYAPRITTPYQLEKKLADLLAFIQEERSKGGKVFIIKGKD